MSSHMTNPGSVSVITREELAAATSGVRDRRTARVGTLKMLTLETDVVYNGVNFYLIRKISELRPLFHLERAGFGLSASAPIPSSFAQGRLILPGSEGDLSDAVSTLKRSASHHVVSFLEANVDGGQLTGYHTLEYTM